MGTATALLTIVGVLAVGIAAPADAQTPPSAVWHADLTVGEAAGVTLDAGTARLDPAGSLLAPAEDGDAPVSDPLPTGLLTLPPLRLDTATDQISATVLGDVPGGSTATVEVRGRRAGGNWSEWIPAIPATALPTPASEVQGRLVLTGPPGAGPAVRDVTLTTLPTTATPLSEGGAEQVPLTYRVFATREGLTNRTTANGHVITERDQFVALPSRRALAPRNSSDYSVKVCAPNGRCAFAPVWDVGPWNTRDDYWNPALQRSQWGDLPQGLPQAQAAYTDGYNGGKDQYDRKVANPAGIDLSDGLFWDTLGLTNNSWVNVDYLWTGSVPLSEVTDAEPVLAAPDAAAEVVGLAADQAGVPVECALGSGADRWLRVGMDQYLPAAAVPHPDPVTTCPPGGDDDGAETAATGSG